MPSGASTFLRSRSTVEVSPRRGHLRQHLRIARLILLNGPPGVGKTTLAMRYLVDHPLALNLDIDSIRCSMGQWHAHDLSKRLARALAVEMAAVHLGNTCDVIIPQLVARLEFIERLEGVARDAPAEFHEIVLLATADETLGRFHARRAAMDASGIRHPQGDAIHDASTMDGIYEELQRIVERRENTGVIHTNTGAVDEAYQELCALIHA